MRLGRSPQSPANSRTTSLYPATASPSQQNEQPMEDQRYRGENDTSSDSISHHHPLQQGRIGNNHPHRRATTQTTSTKRIETRFPSDGKSDEQEKKTKRRSVSHQWSSFWKSKNRKINSKALGICLIVLLVLLSVILYWIVLGIKMGLRYIEQKNLPPDSTLDFLVAGFPKSGTTSLLFSLQQHEQVIMDSNENCQIARPIQQDDKNLKRLNSDLDALKKDVLTRRASALASNQQQNSWFSSLRSSSQKMGLSLLPQKDDMRVGIKCPDAVKNFKAIHRLNKHSPHCKFVIGVRHPILFLQSFYNYRVLEAYKKNKVDEGIPTLFDLWDRGQQWCDISADSPRYELFLSQFGKTSLSRDQLNEYFADRPMMAVKPNRFRIFVYTMEQMQDETQSQELGQDLQHFLNLTTEIPPFEHKNSIRGNVGFKHKETIDICESQYDRIRLVILNQAQATVQWMHEFLDSPDVVVSNRPYFLKSIAGWTLDPCASMDHMKIKQ